ncbi:MAG TPA: lanthionine synthetase LanC family protein [Trebonia sp.]|nr:lanthionine synthetase LanC family protein [Trebonia sp.]
MRRYSGAWVHWAPAGLTLPGQGWKVHVSSSLANSQPVLAVVSSACADLGLPFKHLAGRRAFLLVHDKHGMRVQSGKFCALYPETEERAWLALRRLAADLAGIGGPFVLTDRRFGASECVSYRYGAFRDRTRVDADGTLVHTMAGPDGEIDDQRKPEFYLPPGVNDPFRAVPPEAVPPEAEPPEAVLPKAESPNAESPQGEAPKGAAIKAADAAPGPIAFHGYTLTEVVRHSNAGGAYRFRSARDEPVFIKEARAHNGYTSDGLDAKARLAAEYLVLRAIHARAPGLCPRPVELFQHWEHSFLVTEQVAGMSLYRWMVTNHPALIIGADAADYAGYYRRSLALLDQLDAQVSRLHDLGYVFVDLSPGNVLVDDDDQVRLIDFEAVQPIGDVRRFMGTPGYWHPDPRAAAERDSRELDQFGLAALGLTLVFPLHDVAGRHAPALAQLHADLSEVAPVEPRLWERASRFRDWTGDSPLPAPAGIRADPVAALRWLADKTADALEAMAQPGHPVRVYPTSPLGHQTSTRAVAAGTAGVLLALHRAGRPGDPAVLRRLRDEALSSAEAAAPGLLFGSAGIACVLAELGEGDAAGTLLDAAAKHPLNSTCATLGAGAAGTAIGLLSHHRRTGEQRWADLAQQLLERVPDGDELTAQLSQTRKSGLAGGRPGLALALYCLHRRTGESPLFTRGMRLLGEELAFAEPMAEGGLGFKTAHDDTRVYPYLFAGSAGYAAVLGRYLALRPDAEFGLPAGAGPGAGLGLGLGPADALESCLRACSLRFTVFPGLLSGLAGLAVTMADAGRRLGRPELLDAALASARGLFRYAIPHKDGVAWLGEPGQRISADLWSGSAGILLALRYLTAAAARAGLSRALTFRRALSFRESPSPTSTERRNLMEEILRLQAEAAKDEVLNCTTNHGTMSSVGSMCE